MHAPHEQALKIFVLAPVTPKAVRAQLSKDIVDRKLPSDAALQGGNVYSSSEAVLLVWLSLHTNQVELFSSAHVYAPTDMAQDYPDSPTY